MKNILTSVLILVLALSANGQVRKKYKFNKRTTLQINEPIIKDLTDHLSLWDSVNGESVVEIPYEITIKKNTETVNINGHWCQYEVTRFNNNKSITKFPMDCWVKEFDFGKKKIKTKRSKTDKSFLLPDSLVGHLEYEEKLRSTKPKKPKKVKP